MKCKCNDCGTEFEYDYKISICNKCLLKYKWEENKIINKLKEFALECYSNSAFRKYKESNKNEIDFELLQLKVKMAKLMRRELILDLILETSHN